MPARVSALAKVREAPRRAAGSATGVPLRARLDHCGMSDPHMPHALGNKPDRRTLCQKCSLRPSTKRPPNPVQRVWTSPPALGAELDPPRRRTTRGRSPLRRPSL